jgi:hypothetical protein
VIVSGYAGEHTSQSIFEQTDECKRNVLGVYAPGKGMESLFIKASGRQTARRRFWKQKRSKTVIKRALLLQQ